MNFGQKKSLNTSKSLHKQIYKPEEPECLIIPGTNGEDIMLVPCGNIDGCTLYLESHDLPQQEDGMPGHVQHLGV